jgi:aspartate/methionine/tyrosine aminotransferase
LYTYSQRLPWSFVQNPFSKLIDESRRRGRSLIDLTVSNPTTALAGYPHASIAKAYEQIRDFGYRPDPLGRFESRVAVSEYYARRNVSISPEQIFLTASTSEAYSLLFKLFSNPGDEILAPVPSYPLFEYLAALESVVVVPYRLLYDGNWFTHLADLRQRISSRTRAVIMVNPNNPTGSFWKMSEAEGILDLARERQLPIIADEVFMDYPLGGSQNSISTLIGHDSALSFSLNGLSKAAGMPQMKLAWIAVNGPESDREIARRRLELLLDTYLSVATPVQCALPELLRIGEDIQRQIQVRTRHNLKTLQDVLANSPATCLDTEAGWSAIIQLPKTFSEDQWIARLLEGKGIVVQPGYFFDMASEAYVVVSLLTPGEEFLKGIRRLRELVSGS